MFVRPGAPGSSGEIAWTRVGGPGSMHRLRRLAAEILLDLFRAFLRFIRGVGGARAGVQHLG